MSARRALWKVAVKKLYDRPDGSRLSVIVSRQYVVAGSVIQAECLVRRRNRAWIRGATDCGNGEILWWDCECERVKWMYGTRAPER